MTRTLCILAPLALLAACSQGGGGTTSGAIPITLKDHKFTPSEIEAPAGQPILLDVHNADGLAEEFDSDSLKVEKVIAGGQNGLIRLQPLKPGRYPFMGEYHAKTAQGVLVVK